MPVLFPRQLQPTITMDGTTGIVTEAVTTDIPTAASTICTGDGLRVSPVALDIIVIGKQSSLHSAVRVISNRMHYRSVAS